jgi:hypothetical protein
MALYKIDQAGFFFGMDKQKTKEKEIADLTS